MKEWIVSTEESGCKLITFLTHQLKNTHSTRQIKRLIETNQCTINHRIERFASVPVYRGDRIVINSLETHLGKVQFEKERLLYEDEHFLAYNKPPFINCDNEGILKLLQEYCPTLKLIHRLDRETTGVLLFAKNQRVFERFVQLFKEFNVQKKYYAIVDGGFKSSSGTIENYLGKNEVSQGKITWEITDKQTGLYALTEWKVLKKGAQASLVECYPKTGRTHQIRIHLASIGHPILGDFHYGKIFKCPYKPQRHLLHALKLQFKHPMTEQLIEIEAAFPVDCLEIMQELNIK